MSVKTHPLTIQPSGETIEIEDGLNLLEALRSNNIYVKSSCGGVASCSDCIIKVISGIDYLNSPSFEEERLLGNVFHITKERLSCQTTISGAVTVDLSKHDKSADEQRRLQKTNKFIKRKASEKEAVIEERRKNRKVDDSWDKHWEKNKDPNTAKKLGGGRKPKAFQVKEDED